MTINVMFINRSPILRKGRNRSKKGLRLPNLHGHDEDNAEEPQAKHVCGNCCSVILLSRWFIDVLSPTTVHLITIPFLPLTLSIAPLPPDPPFNSITSFNVISNVNNLPSAILIANSPCSNKLAVEQHQLLHFFLIILSFFSLFYFTI